MPSNFSTANRMYFLTPEAYGEDDLLIEEMQGTEGLSQLFHFRFRLLSYRDDISPDKMIGKSAVLRIETASVDHHGGERHWNGYISSFRRTGRGVSTDDADLYTYECELVPWLWFFTRHRDNRIFQNMSIPDIVEKLLRDAGFMDYTLELRETHPQLEYVTQFRESNLDFMNRLLERAGIYSYYRHDEGHDARHKLILTDHVDANPRLEPDYIRFHHAGMAEEGHDAITALAGRFSMRTGAIATRDWNFRGRRVVEASTPTTHRIGGNESWEHYDYPGHFTDPALGGHYTQVAMQAEEAEYLTLSGASQARQLVPGFRFTLEDHMFEDFNREYLIVSVSHHGRNNLSAEGGAATYSNTFTVQPHDVPFRAPLRTPRPRMYGPQTAIVTGAPGDEIHTDEFGRIKVQFHWDRQGEYNDKSSCWMRVAQTWAGNGYGTMFIPRVGMEVVVDFLDGDPDQPIVTGCVYNGVNQVPYALPGEATKSTIKTLSSKDGGGTNELRFEDKKGKEEVFLQAQRKLAVRVKGSEQHQVGGSLALSVGGERTVRIAKDDKHVVLGKRFMSGGEDFTAYAGDRMSLFAFGELDLSSLKGLRVDSQQKLSLRGMPVAIESPLKISLKVGGSSIVIDPSGVSIVGPLVRLNSGGAPDSADTVDASDEQVEGLNLQTPDGKVTSPLQQTQAQALRDAAAQGQPFCAQCEAARAALEALQE